VWSVNLACAILSIPAPAVPGRHASAWCTQAARSAASSAREVHKASAAMPPYGRMIAGIGAGLVAVALFTGDVPGLILKVSS
jgi:hypothetical protein